MRKSDKEQRKQELLGILQGGDRPPSPYSTKQEKARREELSRILQHVSKKQQLSRNNQEIIAQCQSKERKTARTAFTQLIQCYQSPVYTYISQMVEDEQIAFDMTRDTFVHAYRHMRHIQTDRSVKPWLFKIAKQQMLKASRKQETWYLALLPISVYRWYQQRTEKDEETQEAASVEVTECQNIRSLLSAYIDDELSPSETTRVETHLAGCAHCCLEYDRLLETVALVHTSDLIPAPANLQRAVNAVLDTETLWEQCAHYYEKFAGIFRFSVPQIAVASIALIFLGIAYSSHREQIRHLEAELRATRGIIRAHPEITPTTFVILTGKIVSEEMPLEAGKYVPDIIPELDKAKMWSIAGDITDTGNKTAEYIRSIQGKITADQPISHNILTIRKITAELPEHSNLIVSLFFQRLAQKPPEAGEPSNKSTISIDIYIIDKL